MGQMRFVVPRHEHMTPEVTQQAYLAGLEGIPWPSTNQWRDDELIISRPITESGNLYILWPVPGHGDLVLCTASLMERERPYLLPVELARGTLNRLRNQLADWQSGGLVMTPELQEQVRHAHDAFVVAATSQTEPLAAHEHSQRALELALTAMDELCHQYTQHVLPQYPAQKNRRVKLLGVQADDTPVAGDLVEQLRDAFNIVCIPCRWRDLQPSDSEFDWTGLDRQIARFAQQGLSVCLGPLIELEPSALPDWIYLWEDDYESLYPYATQFVKTVVRRYRGRVHLWNVSAGLNRPGSLAVGEEEQLHLAVATLEAARRADPQTPVILSLDEPWGEYLHQDELDLSPLHFADSLVRTELGLAGLGLELNLGYWPGGTLPRDLLEIARQLDRWSLLGLPLVVFLSAPRVAEEDPKARRPARMFTEYAVGAGGRLPLEQRLLPLLLAKPAVHGVVWNQLSDAVAHAFPNGGMLDATGQPRPAYTTMVELRREFFTL